MISPVEAMQTLKIRVPLLVSVLAKVANADGGRWPDENALIDSRLYFIICLSFILLFKIKPGLD